MEQTKLGLGKALRRAMGHDEIPRDFTVQESKVSVFMNPMRQQILRNLCKHPCTGLRELSRMNQISTATAGWHTKKLMDHEFVDFVRYKNRSLYFPKGYVLEGEVPVLYSLNKRKHQAILRMVIESPGLFQNDLYKGVGLYQQAIIIPVKELKELGLLVSESAARTRYFPTDGIARTREAFKGRGAGFMEGLVEKLKADGVNPRVQKSGSTGRMNLQVTIGNKKRNLRVNTIPEPVIQLGRVYRRSLKGDRTQ